MFVNAVAKVLISRAEKRLGVALDYTHKIAETDIGLLTRYNRLFGFLDPNKHVPALAYHTARLRGAIASDCGTCVQAEMALAKKSKLPPTQVDAILSGSYADLPTEIAAVAELADAVVAQRVDHPQARDSVLAAFGQAGLIELSYAMNGAALLPGIKRTMGYATTCDLAVLRKAGKA